MIRTLLPFVGLLAAALAPLPAAAQMTGQSISAQTSFRIGSTGQSLCSAQFRTLDTALVTMFDRAYAITCRDAVQPIGSLFALRLAQDPDARLVQRRAPTVDCGEAGPASVTDLAGVQRTNCRLKTAAVDYRVYTLRRGNTLYVAEGFAGYDAALQLGLRTLVADRPVPGDVNIALTEAGDPAAFARAQAGTLDPVQAINEAYRRNNSGSFAESAELFATLVGSNPAEGKTRDRFIESLLNQALQQSNLGNFGEADSLLQRVTAMDVTDPVLARLLRNYRTIHFMNQRRFPLALRALNRPLPKQATVGRMLAQGRAEIDDVMAAQLNRATAVARRIGIADEALTPEERAAILDAQASQLRGGILRFQRDPAAADASYRQALAQFQAVREGRLASIAWMRSQVLDELADLAESRAQIAEARALREQSIAVLGVEFPGSVALLKAEARLAAFQLRQNELQPALDRFAAIARQASTMTGAIGILRPELATYFATLESRAATDAASVNAFFSASQLMVRPGVAQTQAVLARELSGGGGEASRLFRQSVTLSREIERTRVVISRITSQPNPPASQVAQLEGLRAALTQLETDQVATQAQLSAFPRFRVLSGGTTEVAELQGKLRAGEAYYKLLIVNEQVYASLVTPTAARVVRLAVTPRQLEDMVDDLRETIAVTINGRVTTYPFNVALAHELYGLLLGAVAGDLTGVTHLIFEPDGALLRLPVNLLVRDKASVDRYLAGVTSRQRDAFDFRGVAWLGRDMDVSTSVSARSFLDVRAAAASAAPRDYIGFGENAPAPRVVRTADTTATGISCAWPVQEWSKPISARELLTAQRVIGVGNAQVVTGAAFSDTAIEARTDLNQFRILHFATHGLVAAPRPECPARPALLTSFGSGASDGLLSFSEIYDLRIDADFVILSACDTAAAASVAATREAGVATGGDFALDGLVRAFVGAGGRTVVASHWPVPDDFGATERLISGLFSDQRGTAVASALRATQTRLMDDAQTSHPYYWSGFAIVGDGARALLQPQ